MVVRRVPERGQNFIVRPDKLQTKPVPFYSFNLDVDMPPQAVAERLKSIVGQTPGFLESMSWRRRDPGGPAFIGTVSDSSFRMRRDIQYRNSFLPLIRGRFGAIGTGTWVSVTMFIHPLVALFVLFWLGMALTFAVSGQTVSPVGWGFFAFGIALTAGGFFPEAMKAKRLISEALLRRH